MEHWTTTTESSRTAIARCRYLNELKADRPDDRRWFGSLQVLADDDAETPRLYQFALLNVRASEPSQAIPLFEAVWNRRDEHDEETAELSLSRAAGIALAAHGELLDDFGVELSADEILEELDREDLHDPEDVVYETLTGGDPEVDAEDLIDRAAEYREEDKNLSALETEAFAELLILLE